MARPLQITPGIIAQVVQRRQRGESAASVAAALGLSKSSVDRAMKYAKGSDPSKPAQPVKCEPATAAPPVDVDTADPSEIGRMIAEVKSAADAAKANGNLGAYASLMSRLVALLEHQRKVTPAQPPDPNEHPDMIAAAKRARDRLHALIESAL